MTKTLPQLLKGARKATPLALIQAAEMLFGQHGIENVSLRQIRLEAGASNNSAIAYHFSDRSELVAAIWDYRLPELDTARRALVDEIYRQNAQRDAKAVLRALLLPNYALMDGSGVHRYAAFFRHAIRWKQGAAIRNARLHSTPASREALDLYHALRPDVPPAVLDYRLRHCSCMFFDMIVERDADIAEGRAVMPEADFLNEGLSMVEAACLRPLAPSG